MRLPSILDELRNRFGEGEGGVGVEAHHQERRHQAGTAARILWHGCKGTTVVGDQVCMQFTLAFIVLHKRVCSLQTLIGWLRSCCETCIMVLLAIASVERRVVYSTLK